MLRHILSAFGLALKSDMDEMRGSINSVAEQWYTVRDYANNCVDIAQGVHEFNGELCNELVIRDYIIYMLLQSATSDTPKQ